MTLLIVLALLVVGLVLWDRLQRDRGSPRDDGPVRDRVRMRRVEPPPRFKGNGRVQYLQGPRQRPRRSPRRDVPSPRTQRFQGTRRRDPNAIGVACGRPIAECTRGEECLCLD
jgi:hypothetical protein